MKKILFVLFLFIGINCSYSQHSVARQWNEALLEAISLDFARPTVHARNLFHTSIAMYDAWSVYDTLTTTYLFGNQVNGFSCFKNDFSPTGDVNSNRNASISYAVYRILTHRFQNSPNFSATQLVFDNLMNELGYDINITTTDYSTGNVIALGNAIAECVINYGLQDGSNEINSYGNEYYLPANRALTPISSGNPTLQYPNRWQPIALNVFIDQSGNVLPRSTPDFLSPEWGNVSPFALENPISYNRNGEEFKVYQDPGAPPYLTVDSMAAYYKWGFSMVSVWGSHLNTEDGVVWDISPASQGNLTTLPTDYTEYENYYKFEEGGDSSTGYAVNPITGLPYEPQLVPRGDFTRVLAEFWADGPQSETPPGHWFSILNYVNDHPLTVKKFGGTGSIINDLEWDTKAYFLLGATMHDAAIAAWSIKGWYDYIRPISAIRYMGGKGQSSDTTLPNYDPNGFDLIPGYIELVTIGDPLAGTNNVNVGKIKLYTWKGPSFINNPDTDVAGVDWILAENWWSFQRPTFVTPPFAGYVSGHSTFSRAAAETLTNLTGSPYFPGGLGEFIAPANEYLVFEEGPSTDVKLQWASYIDASNQSSLSRIWGGIHPPADDIPGRKIGKSVANSTFEKAKEYFGKNFNPDPALKPTAVVVYPNPTTDKLQLLTTEEFQGTTFEIISSTGQTILVGNINQFQQTISLNNVVSGLYIIRIGSKKSIPFLKL